MPIATNNVVEAAARLKFEIADDCISVYHMTIGDTSALTQQQVRDSIGRYIEAIYATFNTRLSNKYTYDIIRLRNISANLIEPDVNWPTLTAGGNTAGDALPPACCAFAFARTAVPRVRGRKFWPPTGENDQVGGLWQSAAVTAYNNALTAWVSTYVDGTTGLTIQPGILSFTQGLPLITITSQVFSTTIAYQRRRKVGRGS